MTAEKKWQKITWARKLLQLKENATLTEIKNAYRKMSKKHHPDTCTSKSCGDDELLSMHEVTEAYNIIMEYCENFRIPLKRNQSEPLSDEDWWMARFGQDPLWGKGGD